MLVAVLSLYRIISRTKSRTLSVAPSLKWSVRMPAPGTLSSRVKATIFRRSSLPSSARW